MNESRHLLLNMVVFHCYVSFTRGYLNQKAAELGRFFFRYCSSLWIFARFLYPLVVPNITNWTTSIFNRRYVDSFMVEKPIAMLVY